MVIEPHWFSMELLSLSFMALAVAQFIRLRQTRRRNDELQAILDAVPHTLFFKDTSLRYRQINAEFCRFIAIDQQSALGKNDFELFGREQSLRFTAQDIELMASGKSGSFEERFTVDGSTRYFQTRKRPVSDRRGRMCGVVGVAIDVTEQVMLQRQVEIAHDRLAVALEAAHMGTWECDLRTGKIDADERARQVLGMSSEQDDLCSAMSRIHPEDAQAVRRRMDEARTRSDVTPYAFRIVDDSGQVRWVEGFSLPNRRRDTGDYLIGVNHDITARRLDEIALADAKHRTERVLAALEASQLDLELALSVGGLGVWQSITKLPSIQKRRKSAFLGTVIAADARIRGILGVTADVELRYRDLLELVHPDDRLRAARSLGNALRRPGAYRDQFRIIGRDAVLRTVDVKGVMRAGPEMFGEDGQVRVAFTGIARDISKDEALKIDLLTKAEEARSAVEAKAQFLAMMSHEVRTPLNGVLGMVELVLDTPLTDAQRSMLQRSRESSIALLTIINDILDFSKIEARKLEIGSRPLSLASLVEDVCSSLAPEAARKMIGLAHEVDAHIPQFILGDSVRLRQVLTNLVGNAIKFTGTGGVEVLVRKLSNDALRLIVRDTGIGIDAEAAAHLFEPFFQAGGSMSRFGGTGLGLTIVKQLVELMQGEVRCESAPRRGSSFTVTLPLRPWPGSAAAPRTESDPAPLPMTDSDSGGDRARIGRGLKVLLAEDHEVNREVVTLQLARLGFECDVAEDGERAWEMLAAPSARYAILLTDCRMPRLDGYELARRVRAHETALGLPRLPIVALTANALDGESERCLAAGMDNYLSKPLRLQEFQDALADILPRPETAEAEGLIDPSPLEMAVAKAGASAEATPLAAYPALAQLCSGDLVQVVRLVRVFIKATEVDLDAMDEAAAGNDRPAMQQLSHRLGSACHQLDEQPAASALRAMERLIDDDEIDPDQSMAERYPPMRALLVEVLARAAAFVRAQARSA